MDDGLREALDSPHTFDGCPARALCASHNPLTVSRYWEAGNCADCTHQVQDHILHGAFGPDECEFDGCHCRYYTQA
jgi:hypothetical protein